MEVYVCVCVNVGWVAQQWYSERSWGGVGSGGTCTARVAGVPPCLLVVLGGALGRLAPSWIKVRR